VQKNGLFENNQSNFSSSHKFRRITENTRSVCSAEIRRDETARHAGLLVALRFTFFALAQAQTETQAGR
jgi:hypothetical protein